MSYSRSVFGNGRVAHTRLEGIEPAAAYVDGELFSVIAPVADVLDGPGGALQRQLIYGDVFLVIETRDGMAFGEAADGGYVGYVEAAQLGVAVRKTHAVQTLGAHVYPEADMKTRPILHLPFGALIGAVSEGEKFLEISGGGFIAKPQLRAVLAFEADPAATALRFVGVPYLWGGDSALGLDCSGLIHTALRAAGRACPRDSDQQKAYFAPILREDGLERGDLVFWKGHVGMMVDSQTMVHANGTHMAVTVEPLDLVEARVAQMGDGEITGFARP